MIALFFASARIRFAVLSLFVAVPLSAQFYDRGDAILNTNIPFATWLAFPGSTFTTSIMSGSILIDKAVPYIGPGRLLVPAPNLLVFHDRHTVSWWNGVPEYSGTPGKGYSDIFTDDAELADMLEMHPGVFLVAEAPNARGAKLIAFDLQHKIAEIPFDGADHIELLADGCTLLYTNHDLRVRRMNVCTGTHESDFATLLPGESAGALRQLANGDVVVAGGNAIVDFRGGTFWAYFPFAGVTHIANSTDGTWFWAAGMQGQLPVLRQYNPSAAMFINSTMGSELAAAGMITDLTVIGEWRASMTPSRARAVRHR